MAGKAIQVLNIGSSFIELVEQVSRDLESRLCHEFELGNPFRLVPIANALLFLEYRLEVAAGFLIAFVAFGECAGVVGLFGKKLLEIGEAAWVEFA